MDNSLNLLWEVYTIAAFVNRTPARIYGMLHRRPSRARMQALRS